jgi:hypothetical protein
MCRIRFPVRFCLCLLLIFSWGLAGTALPADVQLSQLTDDPDPAIRGGQITYSIFVVNNADDTASNVVVMMLTASAAYAVLGASVKNKRA